MDILLYLVIIVAGGFIGYRRMLKPSILNRLDFFQSGALLLLLFIMGVNIGLDETVIASFATIGLQAVVLAGFSIIFSVIGVKMVSAHILHRKGDSR
ncbi:DUF340 domain-containing protein [Anoxynatronum buryatiense]|uniref:DUF340 domain-containing protein n=1 Tax=Anoxynatronum buryatiense TaxID=489973 RepID=A0AA46AIE2_9CLOT|nr:DUF340 domain-containing protein [Anoxynatronum buryatiense]SMP48966.1 hypothetical protein SAMN06296020_103297 [Anoxynatronum buryatiense]